MTYSKKTLTLIFLIASGGFLSSCPALACAVCDSPLGQAVRNEIIHTNFLFFFSGILTLFLFFFFLVFLIAHFKNVRLVNGRALPIAGMLIGGAIAGFSDAILFHQLLQAHAMASDYLPVTTLVNVKVNMFWDGLFECFTLITLLIGLLFLWHGRQSKSNLYARIFAGWLLVGVGLFNFLEGVLDHEFLELHHVWQPSAEPWVFYADILFLLVALIFMLAGIVLIKRQSVILRNSSKTILGEGSS